MQSNNNDNYNAGEVLKKVVEPKLREALIWYLNNEGKANAEKNIGKFNPSPEQVKKLNNAVKELKQDFTGEDLDNILYKIFASDSEKTNNPPVTSSDNFFGKNVIGEDEQEDAIAHNRFDAVQKDHTRFIALYQIIEPALRFALIEYAATKENFKPDEQHIKELNKEIEKLEAPISSKKIDEAIQKVFVKERDVNVYNPLMQNDEQDDQQPEKIEDIPSENYFQQISNETANLINSNRERFKPLNNITEPEFRKALITYAQNNSDFKPTTETINTLNEKISKLGVIDDNNFKPINTILTESFNGLKEAPSAYFTPNNNEIFNSIQRDHNRLAPFYKIENIALSKALINYAIANPNFDITGNSPDNIITNLNKEVEELILQSDSESIDKILNVFNKQDNTRIDHAPSTTYFQENKDIAELIIEENFIVKSKKVYNEIFVEGKQFNLNPLLEELLIKNKENLISNPPKFKKIFKLIDDLEEGISNEDLINALESLGIKNIDPEQLKNILKEKNTNQLKKSYDPFTGHENNIDSEKNMKMVTKIHESFSANSQRNKYKTYLTATNYKLEEYKHSLSSVNQEDISEKQNNIEDIQIDLNKYLQFLKQAKIDIHLILNKQPNRELGNKFYETEIKKLCALHGANVENEIDNLIKNVNDNLVLAKELLAEIERLMSEGYKHNPENLAYGGAKISELIYKGNEKSEAKKHAEKFISGETNKNDSLPIAGSMGLNQLNREQYQDTLIKHSHKNNTVITIPYEHKVGNSTIRTATVRSHDKENKHVNSDFYFNEKDLKKFNAVRVNIPIDNTKVTLPSMLAMEWAYENVKSFIAVMKDKDMPIKITPGNMPEACVKALMIYCKFKDIKYTTPKGYKEITEAQKNAFSNEWTISHPEDINKRSENHFASAFKNNR